MAGKIVQDDGVRTLAADLEDLLFEPGGYEQVKYLLSIVLTVYLPEMAHIVRCKQRQRIRSKCNAPECAGYCMLLNKTIRH